uniref:G_PROTEIN_RECEP_F1_2 domain-containing protein n=1 Tax=Elaeophora elaphi TaxID=1147741 RepID=A0A0R3RS50_9BILA
MCNCIFKALKIIWWSNVICLPTIATIGLTCNLLNILILSTHSSARRIPSWDLLLALAVCDCLFLILATVEVTPTSLSPLYASSSFTIVYIHSALYVRTLASTFYKSSVLLVVIFNLERYICVCHPLRLHNLYSNYTSRLAILICLMVSLLCSLQWPICYRIRSCWDNHLNQHFYIITFSDNSKLQKYYRLMDYFTLIAFNVLPIVIICILNTRLIITLRKIVNRDFKVPRSFTTDAQRFNANAMLFAVVIMLFICVGPQAPARLLFNHYGQYHLTTIIYICITQQLVFLNAALNFCLYCLVSKRYRQLMVETLKAFVSNITENFIITILSTGSFFAHLLTLIPFPFVARACKVVTKDQ